MKKLASLLLFISLTVISYGQTDKNWRVDSLIIFSIDSKGPDEIRKIAYQYNCKGEEIRRETGSTYTEHFYGRYETYSITKKLNGDLRSSRLSKYDGAGRIYFKENKSLLDFGYYEDKAFYYYSEKLDSIENFSNGKLERKQRYFYQNNRVVKFVHETKTETIIVEKEYYDDGRLFRNYYLYSSQNYLISNVTEFTQDVNARIDSVKSYVVIDEEFILNSLTTYTKQNDTTITESFEMVDEVLERKTKSLRYKKELEYIDVYETDEYMYDNGTEIKISDTRYSEDLINDSQFVVSRIKKRYKDGIVHSIRVNQKFHSIHSCNKGAELNENDVNIYPNPVARGELIFLKMENEKQLYVKIYDNDGRLINRMEIDESKQAVFRAPEITGHYYVRIENEDGSGGVTKVISVF